MTIRLTTMTRSLKLIVEALLFSSDRPLNAREISAWIPEATVSEINKALQELVEEYTHLGRSFSLREVAGGYQFRTHPMFAPFILAMLKTSPTRLSTAALETLAIVAYKQPILRQEIERLRGVDVGGILRSLMEKGLIRIVGRKNLPGRPLIYGTTKKFLEVFGPKDLNSLPKLKEIKELASHEQETSPGKKDKETKNQETPALPLSD